MQKCWTWLCIFAIPVFFVETLKASPFDGPFFQEIEGSWTGDGEFTNNSEGSVTTIHEEWTAKRTEVNTFLVSGSREMGDELQEFRWEYSFNPNFDLYECEYWHTGMDEPLRFEVSLTDTSTELRTPFGDPGSELKITNELGSEGIDGHISITDSSGQEMISGLVRHKKNS